ncbi:MAG: hypothetical protein Q7T77_08795 [Sulfuricurvum sp.]|nr:hypothetical protein [Sulfuricurvum sp.]
MQYYWAKFEKKGSDIFRFDTRIYLNPIETPNENDVCVGAIVGKNPGSAKALNNNVGLQPILLDGDKLLPTVRNIILKSYANAAILVPERGYIQVLNLFYLCEPILSKAILSVKKYTTSIVCDSEKKSFPWVWYVWGSESESLNPFKGRFTNLLTNHHFYYDKANACIVQKMASPNAFAKHTQGLKHEMVVPHLSTLLDLHER